MGDYDRELIDSPEPIETFQRPSLGELYTIPENDLLPSAPSPLPPFSINSPKTSPPTNIPLLPSKPLSLRRPSSASAPASPRKIAFSPPQYPALSHFLRRPSFPFTPDDPTISMMQMLHSSGSTLSSSTSSTPDESPRQSSPILAASSPPSSPHIISRSNSMSNCTVPLSLHIRVLVAEDNLVNQNVIKKMLKRMECIVTIADNGKDALNILFESNEQSMFSSVLMKTSLMVWYRIRRLPQL